MLYFGHVSNGKPHGEGWSIPLGVELLANKAANDWCKKGNEFRCDQNHVMEKICQSHDVENGEEA